VNTLPPSFSIPTYASASFAKGSVRLHTGIMIDLGERDFFVGCRDVRSLCLGRVYVRLALRTL
jgi:hypothetical protein